jgi:NAD(P)-dependent dehydrogenase (short-subunit alcohol dehydrogenase family)
LEFEAKTAIVTGAGQGIGQAIAEAFVREGANVVIAEINAASGSQVAQRLTQSGARVLFVQTDVSKEDSVKSMVREAVARFGAVHALCNNAALEIAKDLRDMEAEEWDRVLSVNLRSIYMCTRALLPHFIAAGGGSVVNISSVQALASTGRVAAYTAAKGGMLSMTRDLAQDFGKFNIRVNAICPGCIDTPMQERALARLPNPNQALTALCDSIPMRRTGKPKEIAEAVLFLSSSRASYITGATLVVDGGLLTQLPIPR